jgi:Domain of unknown function (DUF4779)
MNFGKHIAVLLLPVLGVVVVARPVDNPDQVMLRRRMDQAESASYMYRSDNNGPAQVIYLTSGDANRRNFNLPLPALTIRSAGPSYARITQSYAPAYPVNYYPPKTKADAVFKPSQPIYAPAHIPRSQSSSSSSSSSSGSGSDESSRHHPQSHHRSGSDESSRHHPHSHHQSGEFSAEGGHSNEDKFHKKKGHKAAKGYTTDVKFKKAKKGEYGHKHEEGNFGEQGGKKSSHYDEGDKYSEHHEAAQNEKGGKFGSKKHHKKGSKSKGYHNVFMKDEYKKDHTFYGKLSGSR